MYVLSMPGCLFPLILSPYLLLILSIFSPSSHFTSSPQAANLLQASKKYSDNAHAIYSTCPHLNSTQVW